MTEFLTHVLRLFNVALFIVLMLLMWEVYNHDQQRAAFERKMTAEKVKVLYEKLDGRHGIGLDGKKAP